jgi:hypothetical protein
LHTAPKFAHLLAVIGQGLRYEPEFFEQLLVRPVLVVLVLDDALQVRGLGRRDEPSTHNERPNDAGCNRYEKREDRPASPGTADKFVERGEIGAIRRVLAVSEGYCRCGHSGRSIFAHYDGRPAFLGRAHHPFLRVSWGIARLLFAKSRTCRVVPRNGTPISALRGNGAFIATSNSVARIVVLPFGNTKARSIFVNGGLSGAVTIQDCRPVFNRRESGGFRRD